MHEQSVHVFPCSALAALPKGNSFSSSPFRSNFPLFPSLFFFQPTRREKILVLIFVFENYTILKLSKRDRNNFERMDITIQYNGLIYSNSYDCCQKNVYIRIVNLIYYTIVS